MFNLKPKYMNSKNDQLSTTPAIVGNNVLAVRACKNCKHSEIKFKTDVYCMNPECDKEFSNDTECDNYMGVVEHSDECKLFEPLA